MKCPYCIKVCSKCNKILVAYSGNFCKKKSGKYGYNSWCKECMYKYNKKYREENKEEIAEYNKKYREEHKEEIAERNKQYYKENKEECNKRMKKWYEEHKEEIAEYKKQYREEHKEEIAEYKKQYYEENKEEIKEYQKQYQKQYREENKEEIAECKKQWRENNPEKVFNKHNERRNKLENQGEGITKEQWYEMMCFFNWSCAYSGIQLNKDNRSIDHIVPLSLNGEHEIWNCIPMYMPYNSSKNTKNMEKWYKEQEFYSEERLQKIYEWCEYAYNKWGKDEDEKENEKEQKDKMSEL